ncbi:MAG: hypothetical protein RIQ89_1722 [Bacteroidota bacterium]|jgi:CheY-like chemotaxis protein
MGNLLDTVWLIDDNELDLFINKKLIESEGLTNNAITFLNAKEALEALKTGSMPNLIFLDIMMPEMDGFAFLEAVDQLANNQKENIKVIMLSTVDTFNELNRANQNKFVKKFLNKPLTKEMVKALNF